MKPKKCAKFLKSSITQVFSQSILEIVSRMKKRAKNMFICPLNSSIMLDFYIAIKNVSDVEHLITTSGY